MPAYARLLPPLSFSLKQMSCHVFIHKISDWNNFNSISFLTENSNYRKLGNFPFNQPFFFNTGLFIVTFKSLSLLLLMQNSNFTTEISPHHSDLLIHFQLLYLAHHNLPASAFSRNSLISVVQFKVTQ